MEVVPEEITPSRRRRLREGMVEEIKARAKQQLVEKGPGGISLRAVAREMGTASSALFRYFPSYNDLINALVVDAYNSLADSIGPAIEACAPDEHANRWLAICHAYRRWSLDNRSEFALLHGTPLPGYQAPPEVTGPAASRLPIAAMRVFGAAVDAGVADPIRSSVPADIETGPLWKSLMGDQASLYDSRLAGIVLSAYYSMQGYLSAEIFGSLVHLIENSDLLYDAHARTAMVGMGYRPELVAKAQFALPTDSED
jgi:AcrR family transcriptional regulator